MFALYVAAGILIGAALVGGLAILAIRAPSRSARREQSNWDDTNHTSGGAGGPD